MCKVRVFDKVFQEKKEKFANHDYKQKLIFFNRMLITLIMINANND